MKTTKFNIILLLGLFTTFLFNSCSDDDSYSLDKFTLNLATVNPINIQNGTYYLTLDDGTTLWPAASNVNYMPRDNQRVLLNYTILSDQLGGYDHYVKINNIYNILTKNVVKQTPANEKELGEDPIQVLTIWPGDHYLNIRFGINVGGGQVKHTVNLVYDSLQNVDKDRVILEFRHNAHGDAQRYGEDNYVSFDLKPFEKEGVDVVNFTIVAKNYDNEIKEYPIVYKYNQANNSKEIELKTISTNNIIIE